MPASVNWVPSLVAPDYFCYTDDVDIVLPTVPPPSPPSPPSTPSILLSKVFWSRAPELCVFYNYPIVEFRRFLRDNVDLDYHHEWCTARRRYQGRVSQLRRRRKMGALPKKSTK